MSTALTGFTPAPTSICGIDGGDQHLGAAPAQPEGEAAEKFDKAQFEGQMKDFVIRAVNGAVSTHLTRALDSKFKDNNEGLLSQIKEMIGSGTPSQPASTSANEDDAIKNAVAPLQKQLEEERKARERIEATARKERETRMHQEEVSLLQSSLTNSGVPLALASAAVHVLHSALERDDNGNIMFVSKEQGPTGPYEERIPVSEGVSRFLKTDDGKYFLPARDVGGSGNLGGKAAPGSSAGQSDEAFVAELLKGML